MNTIGWVALLGRLVLACVFAPVLAAAYVAAVALVYYVGTRAWGYRNDDPTNPMWVVHDWITVAAWVLTTGWLLRSAVRQVLNDARAERDRSL